MAQGLAQAFPLYQFRFSDILLSLVSAAIAMPEMTYQWVLWLPHHHPICQLLPILMAVPPNGSLLTPTWHIKDKEVSKRFVPA